MRRDRVLRDRLREEVLVTLTNGEGLSGLLTEFDDRVLVLVQAEAHHPDGSRTKADGALLVPWPSVRYLQKP